MAATLNQIFEYMIAVTGESKRKFGDRALSTSRTMTGPVFDTGNIVIADNFGATTLWTSPGGGLVSFDQILFISDVDVFLELVNTVPATDERLVLQVQANSPLLIPSRYMGGHTSNTSRLDGANMVEATDYDEITEIRVQRNAASLAGAATVRLMLID